MPQDLSRVNGQYNDPYAFGGTGYGSISDALGRAWNNLSGVTAQNAFNAEQAQISRDYDMYMSNSAYQRGVADMKAAGLNPASIGGQGNGVNPAQNFHSATASSSSGGSGGIPGLLIATVGKMLAGGLAASINSAGKKAIADDRNVLQAMSLKATEELNSAKKSYMSSSSRYNDARSSWSEYTLGKSKAKDRAEQERLERYRNDVKDDDIDLNALLKELKDFERRGSR